MKLSCLFPAKAFLFFLLLATHHLSLTTVYADVLDDMIREEIEAMGELPPDPTGSAQVSLPTSSRRQMTDADWKRLREQMQGPDTQNITPEEWKRLNDEYEQKQQAARTEAERVRAREEFKQKMKKNMAGNTNVPRSSKPTAEDLNGLMVKLADPNISEANKKRIAGVLFYHSDVYRNGVTLGVINPNSSGVKEYLNKYKPELQQDAMSRMEKIYKNKYGEPLKEPIIPFSYNNVYSDDDLVTGTGEVGRRMEGVYNEALNEVVQERVKRPMTADDRHRVDVNGLAWNMTQEAAFKDFYHPEKYINPQSGFANQEKLIEGAQAGKVSAYVNKNGQLVKLSPQETVNAIKRLAVDKPLDIPGIDPKAGTGSMSDYLRIAEIHKIKPNGRVTVEDIQHFIRNQKYTERVVGDYDKIFQADADLSKEYADYIAMSNKLRKAMTMQEVAKILEEGYGTKIFQNSGAIDWDVLTEVMLKHQQKQLTEVMPKMIGAVSNTEAYKILEWLRTAGQANRMLVRKQLALKYAPLEDAAVNTIIKDIDRMPIEAKDKEFLKSVIHDDSRRIRGFAEAGRDMVNMDPAEFIGLYKVDGDQLGIVMAISKTAKVRSLTTAMAQHEGASAFQQFLESKTAQALNLDTMLGADSSTASKMMQSGMLLLAATRAYNAAGNETEGLKAVGMAMFETIPFVSATLRFSEDEFRESFKELAMDIYPPLALAQLGFTVLNYAGSTVKQSWDETVWEGLVREALLELTDADFEKSSMGYYRLKNREGYMNYLEEVEAGFGKTAKLASMIAPEVDSLMSRNKDVQSNEAALYTVLWFEGVKYQAPSTYDPLQTLTNIASEKFAGTVNRWLTSFSIDQLKARVYEQGMIEKGQGTNAERVAAKIILDNMRIRAEMYTKVLNQFIDRIENRYTELKGEKFKENCDPSGIYEGVMEIVRGPNEEICDPSSIIAMTMAALKQERENAPQSIKDSPWGTEKLEEEYTKWIGYLKDYKPADVSELDLRREMQRILDNFREFIKKLENAVGLYQEMNDLQLTAHTYGGDKSMIESDMILLGDVTRIGVSARVSPKRNASKWSVYYYAYDMENKAWSLLGSVSVPAQKFNPGNDGLWVIENPAKETFYQLTKEQAKKFFPVMRYYRILPVMAFGDWSTDPLSSVGLNALTKPIDYPELFDKDRVAFAGTHAEFGIVRASVFVIYPQWVYRNDKPEVKVALRVPEYAREDNHEASLEVSPYKEGSALPSVDPQKISAVSTDIGDPPDNPSVFALSFSSVAEDSSYKMEVNARIRALDEEYQPIAQSFIVNYVNQDNPEGPQEETGEEPVAGSALTDLLTQMKELENQTQAIAGEISSMEETFNDGIKDLIKELDRASKDLMSLASDLSSLESLAGKMDAKDAQAQKASDDAYSAGEKCAAARSETENFTLNTCQLAQSIQATDDVAQLNQLISQLRTEDANAHNRADIYHQELNNARMASRQAEGILREINSLKADREEAKIKFSEKENAFPAMQSQLSALEAQLASLQEKVSQMPGVTGEASGILEQAQAVNADTLTKDDKKVLKDIQSSFGRISKSAGQVEKVFEKNKDKLITPKDKLKNVQDGIAQGKGRLESLLSFQINDEAIGRIQRFSEEARASYDAAQLFDDAVREAVRNSETCAREAEKAHAQKTSPEAQVARHDCSPWPGTIAKWDSAKQAPYCECLPGNLWDEGLFRCVPEGDYYVSRTDCSQYGPAYAAWDAGSRQALCYCNDGYEFNNARNYCRVSAQVQVSQTNCSMYPNTYPAWDANSETVMCYCVTGYYWDGSQCVYQQQPPPYDPNAGQELVSAMTDLINTINNNQNNNNAGGNTWGNTNTWAGQQQQGDPCERNFYMSGFEMACGCSGYTWSTSGNKCVSGSGLSGSSGGNGLADRCCRDGSPETFGTICMDGSQPVYPCSSGGSNTGGGWTNQGYQDSGSGQGSSQSGLSDVTVNRSPTQITVWDHGTEDYDTVNIYLNNQLVQGNVVLRNARQSLTLYLNQGSNTLTIEAVNEGDPAIIQRMNLPRGNAAAIEINNVTQGKRSQSWTLYTGQRGTMSVYYQP